MNNDLVIKNLRDDIQEECYESVRRLLSKYISKRNDDQTICKMLRSEIAEMIGTKNIQGTTKACANHNDRGEDVNIFDDEVGCHIAFSEGGYFEYNLGSAGFSQIMTMSQDTMGRFFSKVPKGSRHKSGANRLIIMVYPSDTKSNVSQIMRCV